MPDRHYVTVSRRPPRVIVAITTTAGAIPANTADALHYDVTGFEDTYEVGDRFSGGVLRRQQLVPSVSPAHPQPRRKPHVRR